MDPAGCCHGYKELEMNALNTVPSKGVLVSDVLPIEAV